MASKPQFLIAAPSSSSGKTTLTFALLRLLADRGLAVQPFKCGPDYLDPIHHTRAARRPGVNLDLFLMGADHLRRVYARRSAPADVSVAEGMMGLFDGSDKAEHSTARIASLLNLPVVLVIDGGAMAYSAAPLLSGFARFDPSVRVAGAIFNFVNSPRHYELLARACRDAGVEPLGYVPRSDAMALPSRHLGLAVSPENDYEAVISRAAAHVAATVSVDRLLQLCSARAEGPERVARPEPVERVEGPPLRICVASDEAFNFTYAENLRALERLGPVRHFSPLRDSRLPEADLVYLPGGYPELFADGLSANAPMIESIRAHALRGGRILAECGGLIYLGRTLVGADGRRHPMAGLLPVETSMAGARLRLGYRMARLGGREWRGHEFHYSTLAELEPLPSAAEVFDSQARPVATPVYRSGGILASYVHFYWADHGDVPV